MLSEHDYDQMLDAVRVIAEVTDPAGFGPTVVEQIGRVVASDVTSLNDVDPLTGRFDFVITPDSFVAPPGTEAAMAELAAEHPLIRHVSETGDSSAHKISDFWTNEDWHRSALYQRVYHPMGVEHQMAIGLPAPRPTVIGLALNRYAGDFSERDRDVLNRIRPHLAQSWRNAREHSRLRTMVDTAAGALSADGSAAVLLSEPIQELTPGALTDLYRFFGRPPVNSSLPYRVARWLEREQEVHRRGVIGDFSRPLAATRESRRLVVRHLPAASGHGEALLLRVSVHEQTATRLGTLGLTARESQILSHLTSGATNAQIATELNLAASTVKRHLDHVYRKLGVSGRVQAAAVALENLAHHPGG
jgi:DNA-binding CsgD family transcriptional regulator